jgi:hypothetical protein
MFQETYIFVATVFTFNILIFDQKIGLYKPFQFLWSLRNNGFEAHFQNLKTNTFIKSLYQKTTKKSLEILRRFVFKILLRPVSRDLTTTITLDLIGLLDTKSFTYSTFSKISTG